MSVKTYIKEIHKKASRNFVMWVATIMSVLGVALGFLLEQMPFYRESIPKEYVWWVIPLVGIIVGIMRLQVIVKLVHLEQGEKKNESSDV